MAQYEISDKVKGAIMQIVLGATIKGSDAPLIMEIAQTLNAIVPPKPVPPKPEAPKEK